MGNRTGDEVEDPVVVPLELSSTRTDKLPSSSDGKEKRFSSSFRSVGPTFQTPGLRTPLTHGDYLEVRVGGR